MRYLEMKFWYDENIETFATSSPSILSSDEDEVDQLLLASSPNTELSPAKWVKEAEDSKLGMSCHPHFGYISPMFSGFFSGLHRGDPDT
jgi:hypothetical protein